MPDDQNNAGEQQNGQQNEGNKPEGKYTPASIEDALKIITALEKRLNERDSDLEKYKRDLSSYTTAQRKQLEEQGKFKELAEQSAAEVARLKAFEEKATTYEKIIRDSNEARIKNVPDAMKALIPSDYPPEKLQTWLNANEALLVKPPAADFDAGAGNGGRGGNNNLPKLTDFERELARATGVSEKEYAEMKLQRGQPIKLEEKAKPNPAT